MDAAVDKRSKTLMSVYYAETGFKEKRMRNDFSLPAINNFEPVIEAPSRNRQEFNSKSTQNIIEQVTPMTLPYFNEREEK